jgi:hypothetical protein
MLDLVPLTQFSENDIVDFFNNLDSKYQDLEDIPYWANMCKYLVINKKSIYAILILDVCSSDIVSTLYCKPILGTECDGEIFTLISKIRVSTINSEYDEEEEIADFSIDKSEYLLPDSINIDWCYQDENYSWISEELESRFDAIPVNTDYYKGHTIIRKYFPSSSYPLDVELKIHHRDDKHKIKSCETINCKAVLAQSNMILDPDNWRNVKILNDNKHLPKKMDMMTSLERITYIGGSLKKIKKSIDKNYLMFDKPILISSYPNNATCNIKVKFSQGELTWDNSEYYDNPRITKIKNISAGNMPTDNDYDPEIFMGLYAMRENYQESDSFCDFLDNIAAYNKYIFLPKDIICWKTKTYLDAVSHVDKDIDKDNGYIYMLQEREFVKSNDHVYKVGKTAATDAKDRLKQYPTKSLILYIEMVKDCHSAEKVLLKEMQKKFKHRKDIGSEYFEGDPYLILGCIKKLF